jgi:hypothetical protein
VIWIENYNVPSICHWYYEYRLQMLSCSDCGILGYEMTSFAACLPALLGRWRQYFPPKYTHHCDTLHCPLPCHKNLKSHSMCWPSLSFLSCVRTLLSLLFARIFLLFSDRILCRLLVCGWRICYCLYLYLFIYFILWFVYGIHTFRPEAKLY